jgi:hypothetical protein
VFTIERHGPLTDFAVRKIVASAGGAAKLGFSHSPAHAAHACGYRLANDGHDPRAIQQYLREATPIAGVEKEFEAVTHQEILDVRDSWPINWPQRVTSGQGPTRAL